MKDIVRLMRHYLFGVPMMVFRNILFAYHHRKLKYTRKIIYTLTPPPNLNNIGDHAQVMAIRAWMKKHFNNLPVIELDKNEAKYFLPALKWLVQKSDIFFLQSGGNLGDRGMWSEPIRRLLIDVFKNNKIISLPQTIYFSDTPQGHREKARSSRVYQAHPDLTIITRDTTSEELSKKLFPNARNFSMPDFVLSLNIKNSQTKNEPPKILLCLRQDNQSIITQEQRDQLCANLPYPYTIFDTLYHQPIKKHQSQNVSQETLDYFSSFDAIVADRLHALIFAIVCRIPCVALPNVDHKLSSAMEWFKSVNFVALANNPEEVPDLLEKCLSVDNREVPDWNAEYFDKLPAMIGL